jgi:hypothetical protein
MRHPSERASVPVGLASASMLEHPPHGHIPRACRGKVFYLLIIVRWLSG